jgi:tetratricopeptide (TPR) repeat protein
MPGKLSVCMIVRDEADVLPRCLASVAGIADEIVAVDTGSTDGSQAILAAAGARVVEIPWPGDFGEARTAAIRQATGDWVLFIDADEALESSTAGQIRNLLVDLDQPVSFEVPILSYLEEDEGGETTLSWMPRLFNQPGRHLYFGRLHEQLIGSRAIRLDQSVISLRHWGYQKSRIAAKQKEGRNVDLLNAEAEELPGNSLRVALYTAAAAQDPQEVLTYAGDALTLLPDMPTSAVLATITSLILKAHNQLEQWQEAIDQAATLLTRFPILESEIQYWCLLGDAHRGKGDPTAAEAAYRQAVGLSRENRALQSQWNEIIPANAGMALAALLVDRQDFAAARDVLEEALTLPRLSRNAVAQLQGALACTLAASGQHAAARELGLSAVEAMPALRARIANGYLEYGAVILAMEMMAGILDPVALRDRATGLAASLSGDERAVALLEWLIGTYGEDGPTRVNLGFHWLALNDGDRARREVATGLGEPDDAPAVALRLAYFEQVLGRLGDAEDRLAHLVQAASEADATEWLGEALVQWGNLAFQGNHWDKAIDIFTEAVAIRPQDPYVHFALASSRYGQGDIATARQGYERALVLDPGYAGAHQGLAALDALAHS